MTFVLNGDRVKRAVDNIYFPRYFPRLETHTLQEQT